MKVTTSWALPSKYTHFKLSGFRELSIFTPKISYNPILKKLKRLSRKISSKRKKKTLRKPKTARRKAKMIRKQISRKMVMMLKHSLKTRQPRIRPNPRKRKKKSNMRLLKERETLPKSLKLIFSSSKHLPYPLSKMKVSSKEPKNTFHFLNPKKKWKKN